VVLLRPDCNGFNCFEVPNQCRIVIQRMNHWLIRDFQDHVTLENAMRDSLAQASKELYEANEETRQIAKLKYAEMLDQFTRLVIYDELPEVPFASRERRQMTFR
jgi:hypothetical protein